MTPIESYNPESPKNLAHVKGLLMKWFKRKQEQPDSPPQPWRERPEPVAPVIEPEEDHGPGVALLPNGNLSISYSSVAEAKLTIKQLKQMKKQFALEKKAVNAEMAEVRANRRMHVAQQGSVVRGGGSVGRTMRTFQRMSRDMDRSKHANQLAPLEEEKAELDRKILEMDKAITMVEAYIMRESS